MGFVARLRNAWNAFIEQDKHPDYPYNVMSQNGNFAYVSSTRPDRVYFSRGNERSIVTAVYNRIAIDCASIKMKHVRVDDNERYVGDMNSTLNSCLTLRANKDQPSRAFIQDIVMSLLDEGCVAVVPVDTDINPHNSDSFDILSMRTGKIIQWYPDYVEVELYNDRTGKKENIMVAKENCAIIENPLYSITNAPNSTLQRLIKKLNILDAIDEQSGSGKLDLIIQLPYIIKTEARKEQAEQRRRDIEQQLAGSKYGIAYTDGTEKITQLNRPVENNLMKQIEYLTSMLYSQLGITEGVLNGTAKAEEMTNYLNRTIEPIISAIVEEMTIKFLTQTGRTQGQRIMSFQNPFKLIPIDKIADIADKFTRNEILSTNEMRQIIGMKPVNDPRADELRNKNLNPGVGQEFAQTNPENYEEEEVQKSPGEVTIGELHNSLEE